MKRIWKAGLIGLGLALLSPRACALSSEPLEGQVLDEETGKPIVDAIVVVRWEAAWWKFVESSTVCYHVETARTDVQGRYHMPSWSLPWRVEHLTVSDKQVAFDAYKAGYTWSRKDAGRSPTVLLAPFKGTKEERIRNLFSIVSRNSCSGGESGKNLYRLYAPLAEEAKAMAETPARQEDAKFLAQSAEQKLVNVTKPTTYDDKGKLVNVDPNDSYKKEDLLK